MKKLLLVLGAAGSAAALSAGVVSVVPAQAGSSSAPPPAANCTSQQNLDPLPSEVSIVGLAGGELVCFRFNDVGGATTIGPVTGLTGDIGIVAIDFRVQDGLLYGVGNAGGIYTLSTTTAAATKVGLLSVPLTSGIAGVDFNPAANALRIVGNDGQNLRVPFNVGPPPGQPSATTTVDTPLNNGASPPATVTGVFGAAYTNNDLLANTATTLFDLNATTDQVMVQSPANSGVVVATGTFALDAVQGDADIYTRVQTGRNQGYAVIVTPTTTRLGYLDVLSGTITNLKRVPTGVRALALPVAQ